AAATLADEPEVPTRISSPGERRCRSRAGGASLLPLSLDLAQADLGLVGHRGVGVFVGDLVEGRLGAGVIAERLVAAPRRHVVVGLVHARREVLGRLLVLLGGFLEQPLALL